MNNLHQKKDEVRKHNSLIRCSNNLTALQRKAFSILLKECIDKTEKNGEINTFKMSTKEFKTLLGFTSTNHKYLSEQLEELVVRLIKWDVKEDGRGKRATMLSGFDLEDGEIEFEFSSILKRKIFDLGFTSLKINILISFVSKYAIALYELLYQWKQRKWIEFDINEFRVLMGIEDGQYQYMADLKKKVLTPALKEINEKSDLKVFCNDKKRGVKITGFRFEFTVLTAKEMREREQYLIDTEICIKRLKKSFGNKYRIGGKWFVLKKEGLTSRGKVLYNLVEAVKKIYTMKKEGLLRREDIKEIAVKAKKP